MSLARKILSTTAIQIVGKVATSVASLFVIKYITSLQNVPGLSEIPAEYKLIYTYLLFFGILADFGLFTIGVREMSREPEERTSFILGNIVGMRLFTVVSAMTLASLIIFLIPSENYTEQVQLGVAFAAITTVFTMMASTVSSVLQVRLKMLWPTIAIVVGKIIMAGYIIAVVINYQSIDNAFYHLLAAGIVGTFVTYIITHLHAYSVVRFRPRFDFPYWKELFKKAAPYGLAVILSTVYFKIDVLMLSFFRDGIEISIYGFPSTMIEMLMIFAFYFINSVLPPLSKAVREDKMKAVQIVRYAGTFLYLLAAPMAIGGVVLARPMISHIMNDAFLTGNTAVYYGADIAFQLMILGFLFSYLTVLFSHTLVAHDEQMKLLKINAIGVAFNVTTNLILIPHYGFIAAGATTIASAALMLFLNFYYCLKFMKLNMDTKAILKITLASFIMGASVFYLQHAMSIVPTIVIGGTIFIVLIIFFRVIDKETLYRLRTTTPTMIPD